MRNRTFLAPLFIMLYFSFNSLSYGHGEDKPGPNGGFIRMPGAFHVEVVPELAGAKFKIFLLDLSWKNPMTENSKINVEIKLSENSENLVCKSIKDHFVCDANKKSDLRNGELIVHAVRDGSKGAPASYKLPLKYEMAAHH